MSRVKVNSITPFSGGNITLGGHVVPSGSDKNLGSESNPWKELYVSSGSVNFIAGLSTVASIKAGGESGVNPQIPLGMVFTETAGAFGTTLRGSFSVGRQNRALGTASLTVGTGNTASGNFSLAQGENNNASRLGAHAEGLATTASGNYSHAEGNRTYALGTYSHAEGFIAAALTFASHAEGLSTIASNSGSHAEGENTIAFGFASHAEGRGTLSVGSGSHAEGYQTVALGNYSHAEGNNTVASGSNQTVVGEYNELNNISSLFVVGVGTSGTRKDGFSVEADNSIRPHIVTPTNTANPTNPKTGSMYFNPSTNMMSIWNGTTWRTASFG